MTTVSFWAATHTGLVRSTNEDSYGATGLSTTGVGSERDGSADRTVKGSSAGFGDSAIGGAADGAVQSGGPIEAPFLAVVADGLGGHPCGEIASRLAVDHMLRSAPDNTSALVDAVHGANAAIFAAMDTDPASAGMGTTIAALLVMRDGVAVANVGDSCVFESIDDRLVQLTVDDAPAGRSTLPGFPSSVVTQALGGVRVYRPIEPHLYEDQLDGLRRFLVCSDGLTNFVARSEIAAAMRDASGAETVSRLIELVITAGAPDNFTVMVVNAEPIARSGLAVT